MPSGPSIVLWLRPISLDRALVDEGALVVHLQPVDDAVDIAVAVAVDGGLVTPVVRGVDRMSLSGVSASIRDLAERGRAGKLKQNEIEGGSFSISNLGMYGVSNFSAVINAPQAAILAVGAITEKPVVRNGEITTAHLLGVTLACDHRILYGAPAAEFLARIRGLLEEPLSLAL